MRKAIILISDGDDNQSRVYLPEAIKECERAETIIYAISTNWTPSRGEGDKVLQELAEETGGEVFFPPSVEEMATSFKDIEEELRSQYALVYTPADFKTDGAYRTIYLYCYDRRYQVRAKKGYFAHRAVKQSPPRTHCSARIHAFFPESAILTRALSIRIPADFFRTSFPDSGRSRALRPKLNRSHTPGLPSSSISPLRTMN